MDNLAWMAWTSVTACFFGALALTLAVMTVLAIRRPEVERLGVLGTPTTRGDRLFLSLIAAAVIHLIWIGVAGADTIATFPVAGGFEISSLWLASGISLATAVVLFRTV
jgi:predicted small integral membrane protein